MPGARAVGAQIKQLADGELSPVFQSDVGFHLIKRIGVREQDVTEENRRNQAREIIGQRKAEEAYERFLRQLRAEAYVDSRLGRRLSRRCAPGWPLLRASRAASDPNLCVRLAQQSRSLASWSRSPIPTPCMPPPIASGCRCACANPGTPRGPANWRCCRCRQAAAASSASADPANARVRHRRAAARRPRLPRRRIRWPGHRPGATRPASTPAASPIPAPPNCWREQAGAEVVMMLANPTPARRAGHHPPAAARGAGCDHARGARRARCASCTPRCAATSASTQPRIAVLGLNPARGRRRRARARGNRGHRAGAGSAARRRHEPGRPAARRHRLPAATSCAGFDAVLAMYHDQGLPVLKHAGFEQAVNITLGLPYPRVAVDHGTALELAGQGNADPSSLYAAVALCTRLAPAEATPHEPLQGAAEEAARPALPARPRRDRPDRAGGRSASRATRWSRSARARARSRFPLLRQHGALTVIEFDRDLITPLSESAHGLGDLTIVHKDVLKVDFGKLAGDEPHPPGRQPALQHLHADPVPRARARRGDRRHALHAAEGSGRPHGRGAGQQGLRPAQRDAAGACARSSPCSTCRRPRSGRRRRWIPRWCGCLPAAAGASRHRRSGAVRARGARRLRPAPQDPAQCAAGRVHAPTDRRRGHAARSCAPSRWRSPSSSICPTPWPRDAAAADIP